MLPITKLPTLTTGLLALSSMPMYADQNCKFSGNFFRINFSQAYVVGSYVTHRHRYVIHRVVRNSDVVIQTGLPNITETIIKRRHMLFGHVARLDATTPAHQILKQVIAVKSG